MVFKVYINKESEELELTHNGGHTKFSLTDEIASMLQKGCTKALDLNEESMQYQHINNGGISVHFEKSESNTFFFHICYSYCEYSISSMVPMSRENLESLSAILKEYNSKSL